MAIVKRTSSVQGKWLDKKQIVTGDILKIVSEPKEEPSPQGNGMQLVTKVLVKGKSREPENLSINAPSKNALIDAYGEDTAAWVDKIVTAHVEKVLVGGKRGYALYMVPEGMVLKESDDGFTYIGHLDSPSGTVKAPSAPAPMTGNASYPQADVDTSKIPF